MPFSSVAKFPGGPWAQQFQFELHGVLIAVVITILFFVKSYTSQIFAAWPFFTRRYDFIKSNLEKTGRFNAFSFSILHHTVTVIKGSSARKAFFDDKSLSLTEGHKILEGIAPNLQDIQLHSKTDSIPVFIKHLATLLRKDRLSNMIPTLFGDIQDRMDTWGKQGIMDPFKNIHDLVFQMTVSMASCRELATDLPTITEMQRHLWIFEGGFTPAAALFPWFPVPARRAKKASTKALFNILSNYIEERKKAPMPSSDAIDTLLAQGLNNKDITMFVMTIILAGIANTGISLCWTLLFISSHAHWKSVIHAEIYALLTQYTNPSDPLHKRLSAIPIKAWEDEMPTIELVLRETIRLVFNGKVLLRRNLPRGDSLTLPGGVGAIPSGRFLVYSVSDVHMNPSIYTDPGTFDPQRFSPERGEDKREPYSFLGWGAGRHPCAGMKVAKLEIKMIVALFVMGYEYELVDSKGGLSETLPLPDYNNKARPKGESCFIKFKRVVE